MRYMHRGASEIAEQPDLHNAARCSGRHNGLPGEEQLVPSADLVCAENGASFFPWARVADGKKICSRKYFRPALD